MMQPVAETNFIQPVIRPHSTPAHWAKTNFRAMNTDVCAKLFTLAENADDILNDVRMMFLSFENRLTRFHPDSELSRLNNSAKPFSASPTLFSVLESALWAAKATGGLFDPTILENLTKAGYETSFESVAKAGDAVKLRHQRMVGRFETIILNRGRKIIDKPAHVRVDLGGIGKGWSVDRTADRLNGLGPFLINAGGDLYAHGSPPNMLGWEINLSHPLDDNVDLATFYVQNKAVATSSIARRMWRRGDRILHHLIDPRTGQPAETDLLSVAVIGDRVALAEVFAKTAIILGSQAGLDFLEYQPNLEACLITRDERLIYTSGFSEYLEGAS